MKIFKHADNVSFENQKLKANLFWYARNDETEKVLDQDYDILESDCSQSVNSCTEDHHGHRKFYVNEKGGEVDQFFVVVVNTADLNDPMMTETFKAEFNRFKTE